MNNQDMYMPRRLDPAVLLAVLVFFVLAAVTQAGTDKGHGLLWEISKPGHAPSHLFGTIHSDDPGVLALPERVSRAFRVADSVITEVLMDVNAMAYSSQVMLMQDGRLLSDLVGKSLYRKTADAMASRGIPGLLLERMKPWAAAVTLSVPASQSGQVLDLKLYQDAVDAGKAVYGLETIEEQLGLFDSMSEPDQVLLLENAVAGFGSLAAMHADMIAAWKRRDLSAIMAISDESVKDLNQELAADFMKRALDDRNVLMAERMQPHLQKGGAFVAVGALHLPGEGGLLDLLETQGYTVRAVY